MVICIEKETTRSKRLEFNKPYSCVEVRLGTTTDILPALEWSKPQLVWLDYDGGVALDQFADFEILAPRLKSGDFFFLTVNAEISQMSGIKQNDQELSREEALRQVVPDSAIPLGFEGCLTAVAFPSLVGEIWDGYARSTVLALTTDLQFQPLLNLSYADGAKMVTYGGVLLDGADREKVEALNLTERFDYVGRESQFKLLVPQLTHKEKLELDRLMPVQARPDGNKLPFELKDAEIEAYWRFYLHYPTFGEFGP